MWNSNIGVNGICSCAQCIAGGNGGFVAAVLLYIAVYANDYVCIRNG